MIVFDLAQSAKAGSPVQIAFSEKLGAEVFANPDASDQWCRETASLSLLLKDNSPLLSSGLSDFVKRVGATLAAKCPEAKRARIAVYRNSDRKLVAGPYTITAADNWVSPQNLGLAEEPTKLAPAPAPTPTPTPAEPAAAAVQPAPPAAPPQVAAGPIAPPPAPPPPATYVPAEFTPFDTVFLTKVAKTPALLSDDFALRYWADLRFPNEYRPVQNQEFKVRAVLDKARADLQDQAARVASGRATLLINAQLGAYDFQHSSFPIGGLGNLVNYGKTAWPVLTSVGNAVQFDVPQLPALTTLPMDPKEAEAYLARHTRYGAIDRSVLLAVAISYQPGSETLEYGTTTKIKAQIETAWVLDNKQPIYTFGAAQMADLQRDLEAKQREAKRAILAQQRDQNVAYLSRLPADVRLANFLSDSPNVEASSRLDNLASARGRALASQRPVIVRMLVQAGSSGNDHVDTRWPGHLRLTVAQGGPALERGNWYLVEGALSLEGPAEDLKPAELSVKTVFACKQDLCADAQDPGVIVDHKLAVAGGL